MYRTDKITLLLVIATKQFRLYQNCLNYYSTCSKSPAFTYPFYLCLKLGTALLCPAPRRDSDTTFKVNRLKVNLQIGWRSTCRGEGIFWRLPAQLVITGLRKMYLQCDFQIHKLFWNWKKLAKSCIAVPDISLGDSDWGSLGIGELGGQRPLLLLSHFRTVRVQALLSELCSVRRAPGISLNLPLRPAAVGCSLRCTLEAEII